MIKYDDESLQEEKYFEANPDTKFSEWIDEQGNLYHKGDFALVQQYFRAVINKLYATNSNQSNSEEKEVNEIEIDSLEQREPDWNFTAENHPALALGNEMRACSEVCGSPFIIVCLADSVSL